jgi:hypothetical protein
LNIISKFRIFKVGDRVFQIGDFINLTSSFNSSLYNILISILDNGFKFVPCLHLNDYTLFRNLLFYFENDLSKLNKKFLFEYINCKSNLSNLESSSNNNLNLNLTYNCDSVDCFFSKNKKTVSPDWFNFQYPTVEFKLEFLKRISKVSFDYNRNISLNEFDCLVKFVKSKPFKVVELDKNVGVGIMNNSLYNSLCYELLSDKVNYLELNTNPLENSIFLINDILLDLYKNKNISLELYKSLKINKNCKLGSFRILPKVHKTKLSVRPIINCVNHITSNLCLLMDIILKPFVMECESYLKDSQHLLQDTVNLVIPADSTLYSCDFESLYTNINLENALKLITEFISAKLFSIHINSIGFYHILKIIFEYNVFCFKSCYYKQIRGIGMGSKCGPSIANIYVYILEKKFLYIHKPIYYKRFIDDIFLVLSKYFDIKILTETFGELKLNVSNEQSVTFLDLIITICNVTSSLLFSMYIKPTNTFCYLPTTSNHPQFIFDNIPKSIFMRPKRICSRYSDFLYFSRLIFKQLLNRGYNYFNLRKILNMISEIDRDSLISYKEKKNFLDKKEIILKFPFDLNFINFKGIFADAFNKIKNNYFFLADKKLKLVNNMQPNLGQLLVHNFRFDFNYLKLFKFFGCNSSNCLICKFGNKDYYIKLSNFFFLPICCNSDCNI